jgi:hypothetical protein
MFTVGNLLTLGIMMLTFILYHQISRRGYPLEKLREYGKRLKDDLAEYAAQKEESVKNYGVELEVQQQSAKALLERLVITDQELADKAAAIAKIEERINAYDAVLSELDRMTGGVEENLNRIESESAFVENAVKRVHTAEEKLGGVEKALKDIELRFERENADSLEKIAESLVASLRSTLSDLHVAAETIERKVEDHREAVNKIEAERKSNLDRDLEIVNRTLRDALAQAGSRADKLEDAALVKLREQAVDRVHRFQSQVEEKLKFYQENARVRVTELQGLLRNLKEEWKQTQTQIETTQETYKDGWKQDIAELNTRAKRLHDEWTRETEEADKKGREILAALETVAEETSRRITTQAAERDEAIAAQAVERDKAISQAAAERDEAIAAQAALRDRLLAEAAASHNAAIAENADEQRRHIAAGTAALESSLRELRDQIGLASGKAENLLAEQDRMFAAHSAEQERLLAETAEKQNKALADAAAERTEAIYTETAALENSLRDLRNRINLASDKAENFLAEQDKMFAARSAEQDRLLSETMEKQNEAFAEAALEQEERLAGEFADKTEAIYAEITALENHLRELQEEIAGSVEKQNKALAEYAAEQEMRLTGEFAKRSEAVSTGTAALESRLRELREEINGVASQTESLLADALAGAENRARAAADVELARWQKTADDNSEAWGQAVSDAEMKTRALLTELETSSGNLRERISAEIGAIGDRFAAFEKQTDTMFTELERRFLKSAEDTEQKVLETSEERLEEYRRAQAEQFRRLESVAEDGARLDEELRRSMRDTEERIRRDFAVFEEESSRDRAAASSAFTEAARILRDDLGKVEQELAALKQKAYDNVSEKLQIFEEDFTVDLSKRRDDIDRRFAGWREDLDKNLAALADAAAEERRKLEIVLTEDLKKHIAEQDVRLIAELDHLKDETAAFEEGIRGQMAQGDDSLRAFKEQLESEMAEARAAADVSVKAELSRYTLSVAENLKQSQRDLDASLREIAEQVESRNGELTGLADISRRDLEDWQEKIAAQIRETENFMDDIRRRTRELTAETDEQIAVVRSNMVEVQTEAASHRTKFFGQVDDEAKRLDSLIKEADRHIKGFVNQTKLFEQTDALKRELERSIEDFRDDLDRLEQRRSEAAELEAQFIKIKRLEEDVNAKMNNFLAEKRRLDLLEKDFNMVLQTSVAVESKLAQVSASDDTLQAIQVRIRKLDDAMAEAEEKYLRIEKKNQTLEATNEGIDRNFKTLLETETGLKNMSDGIARLTQERDSLMLSFDKLSGEIGKAQEAADKLTLLDEELSTIEERIANMQAAREWLARTETRLTELDREIQGKIKLLGAAVKKEGGKPSSRDKGAPPILTRENVVKLARQGWTVDQIAETYSLSKSEVELILEIGTRE